MAIEALTADDAYDRQMGSDVLDTAVRDPASWLTDVSALWLDHPAFEPCQALFLPPSLAQLSRAPEAVSRQQREMGSGFSGSWGNGCTPVAAPSPPGAKAHEVYPQKCGVHPHGASPVQPGLAAPPTDGPVPQGSGQEPLEDLSNM